MDIQSAYNEWSASYDQDDNRTRDLDREIIRSRLGDLHFDAILEIGCGTGKNTSFPGADRAKRSGRGFFSGDDRQGQGKSTG